MTKELQKRLTRLESERGQRRIFIEERRPDGSRHRISGEGEPRATDLVVTVIRRFEDHSTHIRAPDFKEQQNDTP